MRFLDPIQQQEFLKKGYQTVSLLSEEKVNELKLLFEEMRGEHQFPFTLCSPSYELKKRVFNLLTSMLETPISKFLTEYKITGANFYYKAKNSQSNAVPPHQDWTFVDEKKYSSLNVWVPLIDVDKANGAYHVIEGSHNWQFTYRGSNIPSAAANLNSGFDNLKYLPLKKGQGIIYDHRLIHATPPNISSDDRISLVLNVVPKEAELIHCEMPNLQSSVVKVYEVDEEFFCKYTFSFSKNSVPDGYKLLREEFYSVPDFSTSTA